jgi:hypothetical protein
VAVERARDHVAEAASLQAAAVRAWHTAALQGAPQLMMRGAGAASPRMALNRLHTPHRQSAGAAGARRPLLLRHGGGPRRGPRGPVVPGGVRGVSQRACRVQLGLSASCGHRQLYPGAPGVDRIPLPPCWLLTGEGAGVALHVRGRIMAWRGGTTWRHWSGTRMRRCRRRWRSRTRRWQSGYTAGWACVCPSGLPARGCPRTAQRRRLQRRRTTRRPTLTRRPRPRRPHRP